MATDCDRRVQRVRASSKLYWDLFRPAKCRNVRRWKAVGGDGTVNQYRAPPLRIEAHANIFADLYEINGALPCAQTPPVGNCEEWGDSAIFWWCACSSNGKSERLHYLGTGFSTIFCTEPYFSTVSLPKWPCSRYPNALWWSGRESRKWRSTFLKNAYEYHPVLRKPRHTKYPLGVNWLSSACIPAHAEWLVATVLVYI